MSGCIRITVHHAPMPAATSNQPERAQTVATLRASEQVEAVFACTRKERQISRGGTPFLTLELRDSTGSIVARAFRDADVLAGRFERGELVRVAGRVAALSRAAPDRDRLDRPGRGRRGRPCPLPAELLPRPGRARGLPRASRARGLRPRPARTARSPDGRHGAPQRSCAGRPALRRRARRAGAGPRRPSRLPRRAARAHGGRSDDGDRAVHAAPADRPRPAAGGGDRPRPRQDGRVHLRRRDRAKPRGRAARPRRAGAAADRRRTRRRRFRPSAGSSSSTA